MSLPNVFGTPITDKEYPDKSERARAAYDNREGDGKQLVKQLLDTEKTKYENVLSTLGMIYNATGDDILLVNLNSLHGKIYGSVPLIIQNGQWGCFLHGKKVDDQPFSGSLAALVYRVESDPDVEVLLAWKNLLPSCDKQVYTKIAEKGSFKATLWDWDEIQDAILKNSDGESSETHNGLVSSVKIGEGNCPFFEAMLSFASSAAAF